MHFIVSRLLICDEENRAYYQHRWITSGFYPFKKDSPGADVMSLLNLDVQIPAASWKGT